MSYIVAMVDQPTTGISKLPTEILEKILQYVGNLRNVSEVNHKWHSTSNPIFYKTVRIASPIKESLDEAVRLLLRTTTSKPEIASLIRYLEFESSGKESIGIPTRARPTGIGTDYYNHDSYTAWVELLINLRKLEDLKLFNISGVELVLQTVLARGLHLPLRALETTLSPELADIPVVMNSTRLEQLKVDWCTTFDPSKLTAGATSRLRSLTVTNDQASPGTLLLVAACTSLQELTLQINLKWPGVCSRLQKIIQHAPRLVCIKLGVEKRPQDTLLERNLDFSSQRSLKQLETPAPWIWCTVTSSFSGNLPQHLKKLQLTHWDGLSKPMLQRDISNLTRSPSKLCIKPEEILETLGDV